jgi:hypothetical protein
MMKKIVKPLFIILVLSMLLFACTPGVDQSQTEEILRTIADQVVKLTIQADEVEMLKQALTACPDACPTCEAPPTTTPCPETTPCPVCATEVPTPTPTATSTVQARTASISGRLIYPSEYIPPQRIVAYEVKTGYYYWVRTALGNSSYTISNLPAGTYKVVSYAQIEGVTGLMAGYTPYAACNFTCAENHTLIEFELKEGEHKTGIDPIDWYAPPGVGWPDEPQG